MARRHPVAEADEQSPFGSLTPDEFYARHSVSHSSEFITNARGLKLFTQWWTPIDAPMTGIVAMVHGYTGESSWFVQLTSILFAKSGFATCAIDHQGHGFSDGLVAHIPDLNHVVDDCVQFFDSFRSRYSPDLPAFLYAESLGGAIALYITLRQKGSWSGLVLNGAMCGISAKFKPPWPLEHFLFVVAKLTPTWSMVPTRGSIPDLSFKEEWKRKLALASPRRPVMRPRAATAYELLRVCKDLQGRFEEVEVPLLIVHGGDDKVCDPACVEELHQRVGSRDKTIKIYPGMWHQMVGEPEEDVEQVYGDVVDWLQNRASKMDQILGQMEKNGMFKVSSLTESIMMRILQCAMDRAHEKLKSKKGVLECLNGISKFYELAVLQLEGCLQFVMEERDQNPLESNYEDVLEDLMEIRDRLQGRVREAEVAITEKDMELKERLANEMKLKQAVELKEKELVSLRANLELEKTKSGEMEEFIFNNRVTSDEVREGQFCELKNSVDQQVWNIKQQLESDCEDVDEDRTSGIDNKKVEQMGSDINVLKGTLDVAFGKMHNVMFLSELGPGEHRWRWKIERVITATVFKGSLKDFQEKFEEEVKKRVLQVSVSLSKQLSGMLRDFTCLQNELELLRQQDEVQVKHVKGSKTPPLVPHPNVAFKGFLNARSKSLSAGDSDEILSNFSLKIEDEGLMEHSARDNLEEAAGLVAKMVKNHECIIRRKSDELNLSKRELFQDKRYPYFRREKEYVSLTRRIGQVIVRLENLINWSSRLGDIYGDCKLDYWVETSRKKTLDDSVLNETSGTESLEEVWAKVNKASVSHTAENEKLSYEMMMLKQELGDENLRTAMVEETYLVLLKGLVDEFQFNLLDQHLWCLVKEGMYESITEEITREQDEKIEGIRIESETIEEMYYFIFREATKDFGTNQGTRNETSCFEEPLSVSVVDDLDRTLREDISTLLFQEVYREWSGDVEVYRTESLVKEEIYLTVYDQITRDVIKTANFGLSGLQETKAPKRFKYNSPPRDKCSENVEMLVKDDIWKVLLSGIFEEWRMKIEDFDLESLVREELYLIVIIEAVKGSFSIFWEAEAEEKAKYSENAFPADKLCRSPKDRSRKNLELEKNPTLSTGSESKDRNMPLDLVELNGKGLDRHWIFQKSDAEEDNLYNSPSNKLEKDSTGLCESHFSQYESRSGVAVGSQEKVDSQITPNVETMHKWHPLTSQSIDNEEKIEICKSLFDPMLEASEVFKDFEHPVRKRLEENIMRLDEVKNQLDLLVEPTASLSKKALLYRKAFLSRCDNLHKAETEVDLLGDQVDALLQLLEKLYKTLNQHSPVLQQYFEVGEIMEMIKKEIVGGMNA